ncbi:TPA: hypothetical protein DIC21_01800, partial [Candidatus Uhrbacteria bacterium]|nr:hypothetical protein [Candidatus Uhrbacteria bacterium]
MKPQQTTVFIILLAITALVSAFFGALGGYFSTQYFSLSSEFFDLNNSVDKNIVRMVEEESSTINVVNNV